MAFLESHTTPVIYVEYHTEDINFSLLRYTKDVIVKSLLSDLSREDVALCRLFQMRREHSKLFQCAGDCLVDFTIVIESLSLLTSGNSPKRCHDIYCHAYVETHVFEWLVPG